ncbi:MAG TPA: hypothetical protein VF532_25030 [Candidatus Angelobacter sp.]
MQQAVVVFQLGAAVVVAALLLWRRVYRRLPLFVTYVAYSALATAARLASLAHWPLYWKVYWITEAFDVALALAAVAHSFFLAFRGLFQVRWFRYLAPLAPALVILHAAGKAWLRPPAAAGPWAPLIVGVEIAAQNLIAASFLAYIALRRILKLSYSNSNHEVMLGFAVNSFGMLAAVVFRSEYGTQFKNLITWAPSIAYSCALLIWAKSAFHQPAGAAEAALEPALALEDLAQYEAVLKKAGR